MKELTTQDLKITYQHLTDDKRFSFVENFNCFDCDPMDGQVRVRCRFNNERFTLVSVLFSYASMELPHIQTLPQLEMLVYSLFGI